MLNEIPKTAAKLNAEFYEKVSTEFEDYKNNLLILSPEQIFEYAYAYTVRADIVIAIETGGLYARQAQSLLKADNALDEIFSKWEDFETKHMENIKTVIECKANEISSAEFIKEVRERKARERDER